MQTRPWKKAAVSDGLLSGFRSNGSSSLVVQTGFPTSLADLIVKNHGRLKKASRANKKVSPAPDLCSTPFPALGCRSGDTEIGKFITRNVRSADPGPRFRVLAGTLVILAALLVGKKKLVVWITVSAFSLLVLEFCGGFLRLWLEARKKLDTMIAGFDLIRGRESAAPITQTSLGFFAGRPVSSDREPDGESRVSDQGKHGEGRGKGKLKSSGKCDAKKILKKFMLKKTHGIREDGRILHRVEATGKRGEEDDVRTFKTCDGDSGDGDGNNLHKCFQFVLFLIVLCGLMKGKIVALGLALVWCFLFRFFRVMREVKMI